MRSVADRTWSLFGLDISGWDFIGGLTMIPTDRALRESSVKESSTRLTSKFVTQPQEMSGVAYLQANERCSQG